MIWAKKLPASQPLHVWPGTVLSRLFGACQKLITARKLSLWGCCRDARARQEGETRDPAWQFNHNEEENSYSCIPINVATTMKFCPTFYSLRLVFFTFHIGLIYSPHLACSET